MLYCWSLNNFESSLILQFFKCYKTKPLHVWSQPPHKTALLSKHFVLQFIIVLRSSQQSCIVKNMLLKIWEISHENPCTRFLFNKVAGLRLTLLKRKFFGNSRRTFFILVGSIVNNMERINTRKGTQSTVQCSNCYDNFHFLSECHRSIDNSTDFFLPCREKAPDNNKTLSWKLKTSTWIMNHDLLSQTLLNELQYKNGL